MDCMSARSGTLIFAIFNLILVNVVNIIGSFVFEGLLIDYLNSDTLQTSEIGPEQLIVGLGLLGLIASGFLSVVFAAYLLQGVLRYNPVHIKLYYIYGQVMEILLVASTLFASKFTDVAASVAAIAVIICVLYALILAMIERTYNNMAIEITQKQIQPKEFTLHI